MLLAEIGCDNLNQNRVLCAEHLRTFRRIDASGALSGVD